jgi:hypothetical protein
MFCKYFNQCIKFNWSAVVVVVVVVVVEVFCIHAMEKYRGRRGITPLFLNLGTRFS